jgi:hypothetical protein
MPSKPSGDQATTENKATTTTLPDWVNQAAKGIWGQAVDTSQNLAGPYTGQRVANLTPGQNQLTQGLQDSQGYGASQFYGAQLGELNASGYNPQNVTPGMLSQTDLSPYMNPYTQDVINKTMPLFDQSLAQQQNQTADQAIKTGAFAGSRQGVSEAVNNAQTNLLKGQFGAGLNQANFQQAQQGAIGDITRQLQAAQGNQQAGLQGNAQRLAASQALGNTTAQASQDNLSRIMAALQGQGMVQGNQQQQLDAAQQLYGEQRQQPLDQLNILLQAIKGVPYGQTQTSTGTGTSPGPSSNPGMTALGAAGTAASIAGSIAAIV